MCTSSPNKRWIRHANLIVFVTKMFFPDIFFYFAIFVTLFFKNVLRWGLCESIFKTIKASSIHFTFPTIIPQSPHKVFEKFVGFS